MQWLILVMLVAGCAPKAPPVSNESTAQVVERLAPPDGPHRRYVTATGASVCPTAEQALKNECGHTVDDEAFGYRLAAGDAVMVQDATPQQGVWRTTRYMKAGEVAGFVADERVVATPPRKHHDGLGVLAKKRRARKLERQVKKGQTVVLSRIRSQHVQLTTHNEDGEAVPTSPVSWTVRIPPPNKGPTDPYVIELPDCLANADGRQLISAHGCLENMDCDFLDYQCDEAGCDTVSILARATGEDRAVASWDGSQIAVPYLRAIAIADRMGLFRCP